MPTDDVAQLAAEVQRLQQAVRDLEQRLRAYEQNGLNKLLFANQASVWAAVGHTHP